MGLLDRGGARITPHAEDADILVVNTCSFIDSAKQESVDAILEMAQHKVSRGGRARRLIVAGCLVERYRDEIQANIPEVDAVVGTDELESILQAADSLARQPIPSSPSLPAAPLSRFGSSATPVPFCSTPIPARPVRNSSTKRLPQKRNQPPAPIARPDPALRGSCASSKGASRARRGMAQPPHCPLISTQTRRPASSPRRAPQPISRLPRAVITRAASASFRSCAASSALVP